MSNELRIGTRTQTGRLGTDEAIAPPPQAREPEAAKPAGKLALLRSSLLQKVGARPLASNAPSNNSGESQSPRGASWIKAQIREKEETPAAATGGGGINNGPPNTKNPRLASGGADDGEGEGENRDEARKPLPRAGSSAGLTAKQDVNTEAFQNYVDSMAKNVDGKSAFFERHLREMGDQRLVVVDLGASGGELTHALETKLPQHKFLMVDMNPDAMRAGGHTRGRAVAADAFFLPLGTDKLDAVMMSSFLHELYSYAPVPFSRDYAVQGLKETGRILRPGGKLMIRDPARPEQPDEVLRVQPFRNNGTNPTTRDALLASDPAQLSSASLLERFLIEFPPAAEHDPGENLGKRTDFNLPAWVTSEFIRHRVFARDINDWTSELRECYGVFTTSELADAAQQAGFRVDTIETGFNAENRSVGYGREMRIFSSGGEEVDQATRFPTQVYAVLTLDGQHRAE